MPQPLEATLMHMLAGLGPGASLNPNDIAKAAHAGDDKPESWRRDLPKLKAIAVGLARQGKVEILRKGKPVSPDNLKGIYRLKLPPSG